MHPTMASPEPQTFTLIAALRDRLRADTGQPVELQETHISWVLLTDRLAYKLKKPLRLPFVDFSTLALRKHFCEEEVRLNRRLAPSLYLGVAPVRGTVQAPYIGEFGVPVDAGHPIDYAVCMQRFAPGALLSERLAAGTLLPIHLERLAWRLADFHRDASAAPPAPPDAAALQAVQPVLDVLAQLQSGGGSPFINEVSAWVQAQMPALQKAWPARRQSGAVRECHGDLHLANAVLINDEVTAFDCLEFDPALRWIDVMSDVAFLTMDLKAHGRGDLAHGFLDAYLQRSGDYAGVQVLRFYEVYRALVRALVAQVRGQAAGTAGVPASLDYLACARQLALTAGGPARLLITHGLSGSGKTTVAGQLLAVAGAIRLRSDVERKRLFGLDALQRSVGLDLNIYTPEASRRTFDHLRACARTALLAGYPVIVDAAFLRRADRRAFQALAAELGVPFTLLHCRASPAQLRQRLAARQRSASDASEADVKVLEHQLADHEPLDDVERVMALELVTDGAVDIDALRARWLLQV
jgi:aminoglycoside phosphotransferase family enzyme/predicted kinase